MTRLSFQQKMILSILADERGHIPKDFNKYYSGCHVYSALQDLLNKDYIIRIKNKYYLSSKGEHWIFLYNIGLE